MPYKCFLIEETGERWEESEPCSCGCGENMKSSGSYWRRTDTGEVRKHIRDFPVGAMWYLSWYRNEESGLYNVPGFSNSVNPPLCVKTPGGDWVIDSRASNCTLKDDDVHRCWIRHGDPPNITVDKSGHTCGAGAGSIMCGNYHGFLRNGFLTDGC